MSDTEQNVLCWLDAAASFALPEWESLPSIPLYMDQVMMFARETLSLYAREENQSPLTSSMVNNYVKTGLVDHPDHKRYGKKQLAQLVMTGLLKQVLSIQDLTVLFDGSEDPAALYDSFVSVQNSALKETSALVKEEMGAETMRSLAMRLASEANARRAVAERILSELSEREPSKKAPEKQRR